MSATPKAGAGGPVAGRRRPLLPIAAFGAFGAVALHDGAQSELATATIAVVAWWAIALALLATRPQLPRGPAALAIGALAGLTLLIGASAAWATDDGRVVVELVRAIAYLGVLVVVVAAVRPGGAREVLAGLAAALVAVALVALGARLAPELLTGDRSFLEQFPEAVRGRLSYPIGYWNGLASCMAAALVLLGWGGAAATTARGRALAVAAIPAVVLALYLTGSRGGLLAAAVGLALMLALVPVRVRALAGLAIGIGAGFALALAASTDQALVEGVAGRSAEWWMIGLLLFVSGLSYWLRRTTDRALARPRTPRLLEGRALLVASALALGGLFLLADGIERVSDFEQSRVDDFGRGEFSGRFLAAGSNGRLELWRAGLDAFASEPLHGLGAGAYGFWWNQNGTLAEPARDAHSLFVESLAELGPGGLIAVLAFFGAGVVALGRRTYGDRDGAVAACAGVLAVGTVGAGLDWTWEIPAAFALPLLAVGLLCGRGTEPPGEPAMRPARGSLWRPLILAVAVACVLIAGSLFLSERALDRSRDAAAAGDPSAAAEAARDAARLQPSSSEPWFQLGLVQHSAGDIEGAKRSIERAEELSPESPQVSLVLSLLYFISGDPRLAEQRERTIELLPRER